MNFRPDTLDIPDADLRSALEEACGKNHGEGVTRDELAVVTKLDAHNRGQAVFRFAERGIRDLDGIEYAVSLKMLRLDNNRIRDVSALGALGALEVLDLAFNRIRDISALGALRNLRVLNLAFNDIRDVSALGRLGGLEGLNLEHNRIRDVSALRELGNLRKLYLCQNRIKLRDLTNLYRTLHRGGQRPQSADRRGDV